MNCSPGSTYVRMRSAAVSLRGNKNKMSEKNNFVWTDEEVTLLMSVVNDFKTQNAAEGSDWIIIKNKYEELAKKYIERYPKSAISEFPKSDECEKLFTKERLCSKLKRIQSGFKKAIDSGRRSGGGRIVTTFYGEILHFK